MPGVHRGRGLAGARARLRRDRQVIGMHIHHAPCLAQTPPMHSIPVAVIGEAFGRTPMLAVRRPFRCVPARRGTQPLADEVASADREDHAALPAADQKERLDVVHALASDEHADSWPRERRRGTTAPSAARRSRVWGSARALTYFCARLSTLPHRTVLCPLRGQIFCGSSGASAGCRSRRANWPGPMR